jgi:hypothetical protein
LKNLEKAEIATIGDASFRKLLVGAIITRELEISHQIIRRISKMAADIQHKLTASKANRVFKKTLLLIEEVLIGAVKAFSKQTKGKCPQSSLLKQARFR